MFCVSVLRLTWFFLSCWANSFLTITSKHDDICEDPLPFSLFLPSFERKTMWCSQCRDYLSKQVESFAGSQHLFSTGLSHVRNQEEIPFVLASRRTSRYLISISANTCRKNARYNMWAHYIRKITSPMQTGATYSKLTESRGSRWRPDFSCKSFVSTKGSRQGNARGFSSPRSSASTLCEKSLSTPGLVSGSGAIFRIILWWWFWERKHRINLRLNFIVVDIQAGKTLLSFLFLFSFFFPPESKKKKRFKLTVQLLSELLWLHFFPLKRGK